MKRAVRNAILLLLGAVAVIAVAGVIRFDLLGGGDTVPDTGAAPSDLLVTIDGQQFGLRDGIAELPVAAGSSTGNILRVVGRPVLAAPDAAGERDAALILVNEPGGSGRFYYAVAAVADVGSYRASNVLPLGDRIIPQGVDYRDGRFVYRYLDRRPDQPMSDPPTVQHTLAVRLDRTSGTITAEP